MLLEEALQAVMQEEIKVLRNILSNFKQEHFALLNNDKKALDGIIDERLVFLEGHRSSIQKLLFCAGEMARKHGRVPPANQRDALEIFEELISIEDIELRSLREQLSVLIDEMDRQNHIPVHFLQKSLPLSQDTLLSNPHEDKQRKIKLEVLDH